MNNQYLGNITEGCSFKYLRTDDYIVEPHSKLIRDRVSNRLIWHGVIIVPTYLAEYVYMSHT